MLIKNYGAESGPISLPLRLPPSLLPSSSRLPSSQATKIPTTFENVILHRSNLTVPHPSSMMSLSGASPAWYPAVGDLVYIKRHFELPDHTKFNAGEVMQVCPGISRLSSKLTVCQPHFPMHVFQTDWKNFTPYGPREDCDCNKVRCGCVFEDFDKSKLFSEKIKLEIPPGTDTVSVPTTVLGQRPGANLIVKHIPAVSDLGDLFVCVGDVVTLRNGIGPDGNRAKVTALNLRTQEVGPLLWEALFPVGPRDLCLHMVDYQRCNCIFSDLASSKEFGLSSRPAHLIPQIMIDQLAGLTPSNS